MRTEKLQKQLMEGKVEGTRKTKAILDSRGAKIGAGLNDGLFSETMDFRDFPSVLSAVRIAES